MDYVTLLQRRILAAVDDSRAAAAVAYQRGRDDGYEAGWLACVAELKRAQQQTYKLIRDSAPLWAAHYKTLRRPL
jgi:predicted NAD/FAD-dependent oxidoreductase